MNSKLMLPDGSWIPQLGLGTWMLDDTKAYQAVSNALSLGYRLIDTAEAYDNEEAVGKAIRDSKIKREEIFLQTKLIAEAKTYEEAKREIEKSFERLQVSVIDAILIHAPEPWAEFRGENHYEEGNLAAWRALTEYYQAGKVKAIGVSNFEKEDLENLIEHSSIKPMINQILTHISNTDFALLDYCKRNGILVEAYSPIGHGALLENKVIQEMAKKYHVSVSQLCIRYTIQLGLVTLPKATGLEHLRENGNVDFIIQSDDMELLMNLQRIQSYGDSDIFPCYAKQKERGKQE